MIHLSPEAPRTAAGPLFVSRGIIVVISLMLWVFSAIASLGALGGNDRDRPMITGVALDLVGFGVALLASSPKIPRRYLPYLRLTWLMTSIASGMMTAEVVTPASGYLALAFNVMLGTALVFLVSLRWDLMGFILMIAANSVLSSAYYAATPRLGSGEGLLIFFITLIPGLLGALTVVGIRSRSREQLARRSTAALAELARQADTHPSLHTEELSATHQQIQELFSRAARSEGAPLAPGLAEEAQELASRLRAQLMTAHKGNWFTESLAVAGVESQVTVAAQPDLLQRIPQVHRVALLSVTMMLLKPALDGPGRARKSPRAPGRLHVYVEPYVEGQLLITWRVHNLNPSRCTPALWSEIESLGTPRVHTDPGGASVMVHVKAPRLW